MKLNFIKVNPAQNATVFIMDQIPREDQSNIAKKLMDYGNIYGEQVGFIEQAEGNPEEVRLQMMGGEFCGNASRSFAAYMVYSEYPQIKEFDGRYTVTLEVSGLNRNVVCEVTPLEEENQFMSRIKMPLPDNISTEEFMVNGEPIVAVKVDIPGITHFIVDQDNIRSNQEFFQIVKDYMEKSAYEAFGIMFYNYEDNFMTPLVYVKGTDTLLWEKSCASGTSALGAALSYLNDSNTNIEVQQPGGMLKIDTQWKSDKLESIYLDGMVEIVAEGYVIVH